ncbi:MAG: uracil-DNA glycosylase family protein [Sporichthyaceae bacterium]
MSPETLGATQTPTAEAGRCAICVDLPGPRNHGVVGTFPADASLLILSGAPTKQEESAGRPFVGRPGHHLDFLLGNFGILRKRQVATLSVANCRSGDPDVPTGRAEIEANRARVLEQIEEIDPLLIVTLGPQPTEWALGRDTVLSAVRGHLHQFGERPLLPSHAPVAAIHCGTRGAPALQLEQDLRYAADLLADLRKLRGRT